MSFYKNLKENEQYGVVSVAFDVLIQMKKILNEGSDFTVHYIKQNNPKYDEDEVLQSMYSEKSKLMRRITKREQELNK